jgi:hypothetical protein
LFFVVVFFVCLVFFYNSIGKHKMFYYNNDYIRIDLALCEVVSP